jgi:hypothetical protein
MVRPMGYATLAEAIDDLTRRGFTEQFSIVEGGLRAVGTGTTFSADDLTVLEYHRFEGVSDPDDTAIVYAIETGSGVRGTLVDAFGVYSNPSAGAALTHVPIRDADGSS